MNTSDVQRIESQLAAELPASYREFLLAYPEDAPAEVRRYDLFDDATAVMEETLVFRRYLVEEASPERLLVIGDSGCGDKVCLELETGAVLFWSHAEEDFAPIAESISEYYAALVEPV